MQNSTSPLRDTTQQSAVSPNALLSATHGSAEVPRWLQSRVALCGVLQRNFSDFTTGHLLRGIPEKQIAIPRFGRIAGDMNRARDAEDIFREADFGGNPVWQQEQELRDFEKEILLRRSYDPYHARLANMLTDTHGHEYDQLLWLDVHDTGNRLLGTQEQNDRWRDAADWMPPVVISSRNGITASSEVIDGLRRELADALRLSLHEVEVDTKYKGGYVTEAYGNVAHDHRRSLQPEVKHEGVHLVQLEFDRRYLDETMQIIKWSELQQIRTALHRAVTTVADGLRNAV